MELIGKVAATIRTRWKQLTCNHGPWIKDLYTTDNLLTCHCRQCWKVAFEDSFPYKMARAETCEEWLERATAAGMPLDKAKRFWAIQHDSDKTNG